MKARMKGAQGRGRREGERNDRKTERKRMKAWRGDTRERREGEIKYRKKIGRKGHKGEEEGKENEMIERQRGGEKEKQDVGTQEERWVGEGNDRKTERKTRKDRMKGTQGRGIREGERNYRKTDKRREGKLGCRGLKRRGREEGGTVWP